VYLVIENALESEVYTKKPQQRLHNRHEVDIVEDLLELDR